MTSELIAQRKRQQLPDLKGTLPVAFAPVRSRNRRRARAMRRTVVDTCVFVDFLRGRPAPRFERLLRENSVLLSPHVRLELLQGVRREEARLLGRVLEGIPQVPHRQEIFPLAEAMPCASRAPA